jgi:phosphate transport system substrate-binding protein
MRITKAAALAVILGLLVPAGASAARTLIGSGSYAAEPYLRVLFKGYRNTKEGKQVKFIYTANGGNAGVKDVQEGRSSFAVNPRLPLPSDSGTRYKQMFLNGLCIAVHPSNKLSNITIPQLRDVFSAISTNWSAFPSSGLDTTIAAIGRDPTAGQYTFFQQAVLDGRTQASNVRAVPTDGQVGVTVSQDPDAIGYVGMAHARPQDGVKKLTVDGQPCEPPAIKTLKYPLSQYIWLVVPSTNPDPAIMAFGRWVATSHKAGVILSKAGGVPATNKGF